MLVYLKKDIEIPSSNIVTTTNTTDDKLTPDPQPQTGASQPRQPTPSIPRNPNHLDRSICVDGRKATSRELANILRNGIIFSKLIF